MIRVIFKLATDGCSNQWISNSKTQENLSKVSEILESHGELPSIRRLLKGLAPREVANLIESSPPRSRQLLWDMLSESRQAQIVPNLSEDVAAQFIEMMDRQQVADLTEDLSTDDVADILQHLPDRVMQEVLSAMTAQNRARIESVLSYEEDCWWFDGYRCDYCAPKVYTGCCLALLAPP